MAKYKCFTVPQAKKYGLEKLSQAQQLERVNQLAEFSENSARQTKIQAIIIKRNYDLIKAHPKGIEQGLRSLVYTDRTELFGRSSLEANMDAINAFSHSKIAEMMSTLRPKWAGFELRMGDQRNLLRVIFGETANDPKFGRMANQWGELAEYLRVRFNKAGGAIKKLSDWNLPTHHDATLIARVEFDEWFEDVKDLFDFDRMDLQEADARQVLQGMYTNITTEGLSEIEPGRHRGVSKVGNKHQQARSIHFKDADSYLKYHEKYSSSTPYNVMTDYITMMSNEIGMMESLGPNPDIGFATLRDIAKREGGGDGKLAKYAYDNISGNTASIAENQKLAKNMQMIRNITTGLKLPGAMLSALSDVILNAVTARYNGLPAMGVMKRLVGNLKPESLEDRLFAARMLFPLRHLMDEASSATRFADVTGHTGSARFSSAVMRLSGLNPWTIASKKAFHFEFMSALANDSYHANLEETFKRYGINSFDIDEIKGAKRIKQDGVEYLDVQSLKPETMQKVAAMIITETKIGTIEGDAGISGMMNLGSRKGTLGGELGRTAMLFKTFPMALMAKHWSRAWHGRNGSNKHRASYIMQIVLGTWAMGTLVVQLKEIAAGREPIDWDNKDLWTRGFNQAGVTGFIGDLVRSDSRSFGGSAADFLAGPVASDVNKILWRGLFGSYDDMIKGETTLQDEVKKAFGEAADFVPFQFWYTKTIMERAFLDEMRRYGDPNFDIKEMRRERERYLKFGNEEL